ncbi:2-amino-4-hydroxy-6-hydroxymethyldihydropteridine diphosphokinase [Seohaeicola saemankumensis]|nr:2-amino-4-hydroxy-6-hydroxymethyldihydropteridine diphosphokinase [Seohaeicola saemankumensis]MCA0872715.1 2-amino-4-hydroxy-6-hydroxymethyldihydropteridine diphosphokinase [Seohaeicola saemankumensis]
MPIRSEIRPTVLIAIGANLPSDAGMPDKTLISAVSAMPSLGLAPRAISRFYATPCFPAGAGPDYVNAALQVETTMAANDVLAALHRIEARFGRRRDTRWGMRTLDLDLIAWGDLVLPDRATLRHWMTLPPGDQAQQAPQQLILPHPRLQDRGFVLVPLADIAPQWVHPVLGQTVIQMRNALPDAEIRAIRAI